MKNEDLVNTKINCLEILDFYVKKDASGHGRGRFKCRCKCGKVLDILAYNVKVGHTKSCGCYFKEINGTDKWNTYRKHGFAPHNQKKRIPEYNLWKEMRARCNRAAHKNYDRYGARGIKVCERWDDFTKFIKDMGRRPGPKHTLDRIDNNGNYEPGNCRWATWAEQANNTSRCSTHLIKERPCLVCKKVFKPHRIASVGKYCSSKCYHDERRAR